MFDWRTNVVCTSESDKSDVADCQFTDASTGYTYDFSALVKDSKEQPYHVRVALCSVVKLQSHSDTFFVSTEKALFFMAEVT